MPNLLKKRAGVPITTNELYEIAEELHICIDDFRFETVKSMSQMSAEGTCYIALDSRQILSRKEERAILSHELGHCLTGSFYNRHTPYDIRNKHERRADKKAAYMLVPLNELVDAVCSPWNSIYDLAELFGVPEDFMKKTLEIYEQDLRDMLAKASI